MTGKEVLEELKAMGSESIKKVLVKHGAREPFYGVKTEHLKKLQKKIKTDQKLAMELYDSGISDAMYLAGMIAEPAKIAKKDLQHWADKAYWSLLSEHTVASVAAESPYAMELALEWIESPKETIACCGWSTLGFYASIKPDTELDIALYKKLADRVAKEIHSAPNRVRHNMNGFLISTGSYIAALTPHILKLADKVGKVEVFMGDTACKVPLAKDYILKIESMGRIGQKRKTARC